MTIIKTIKIFLALLVLVAVSTAFRVEASEITGILNTGLNATVGNGVEGVVVAPPIANPTAGVYTSAQNVTLTAAGATSIRYTTDGSVPSCTVGTIYSGAVSVSSSLALQAISCYPGSVHSGVASYLYAINPPSVVSTGGGGGGGGGGGAGSSSSDSDSADINKDGDVDILDFVILMAQWGQMGAGNSADLNSDNAVNILDFVILMAEWTD
ncbi:MAG: chitobiase/beta-hexosaminidase C-terminal domain-containing protein [Patescibacteria group bacterium]